MLHQKCESCLSHDEGRKGVFVMNLECSMDLREHLLELQNSLKECCKKSFHENLRPTRVLHDGGSFPMTEEEEIMKHLITPKLLEEEGFIKSKLLDLEGGKPRPFNLDEYEDCDKILFLSDLHLNSMHYTRDPDTYFLEYSKKLDTIFRDNGITDKDRCLFVFLGDLTDFGTRAEFYLFRLFVSTFGLRNVCVLPGEHDVSTFYGSVSRSNRQFVSFVQIMFLVDEVTEEKAIFPKLVKVGKHHHLILLDSNKPQPFRKEPNLYETHNGELGDLQISRLEGHLEKLEETEIQNSVVLCIHHHAISKPYHLFPTTVSMEDLEDGSNNGRSSPQKPKEEEEGDDVDDDDPNNEFRDASEFRRLLWKFKCVGTTFFGHVHDSFIVKVKRNIGGREVEKRFISLDSFQDGDEDNIAHVLNV